MRIKIAAALVTVYAIWGSTYLAIRIAIDTIPPFLMAGARFLLAGSILLPLAIRSGGTREPITLQHWKSALVVGAALLLGGNGGVVWAEQRIASGIAALIIATVPMWMAVFDRVIYRQRITGRALIGLVVGFAGIAVLAAPTGGVTHFDLIGIGVLLFASVSWALGSLYSRRAPSPKNPLVGSGMQMLAGGACLAVAGLLASETGRLAPASISTSSAIAFAYLIVFGAIAGFSAYVWLLRNAPTSVVGTYAYVNPVVAVILGWAILNEQMSPRTLIAAAIILSGVALIMTSPTAREIAEAAGPADAPSPAREAQEGTPAR